MIDMPCKRSGTFISADPQSQFANKWCFVIKPIAHAAVIAISWALERCDFSGFDEKFVYLGLEDIDIII